MNEEWNEHDEARLRQLDRLAMGELDEQRRRDLILWLDELPFRWRQCGLAFIEVQALEHALADASPTNHRPLSFLSMSARRIELPHAALSPASASRPAFVWMALAASWFIVFLLGLSTSAVFSSRSNGDRSTHTGGPRVASSRAKRHVESPRPAPANDGTDTSLSGHLTESALEPAASGSAAKEPVPSGNGLAVATIRPPNGAAGGELTATVFAGEGIDQQWLSGNQAPVPDYIQRQFERKGFHVQRQRRVVPLQLSDGRRVSLPLEELKVNFVGHKVY